MDTKNTTPELTDLDSLEETIIRGLRAYEARNNLIVRLVTGGTTQAAVARHLNSIRTRLGADTITPDAVAATIKRVRKSRP